MKKVCYTVCKPVQETCIKECCETCYKTVQETCYKDCVRTVCKPVCTMKTVQRKVSETLRAVLQEGQEPPDSGGRLRPVLHRPVHGLHDYKKGRGHLSWCQADQTAPVRSARRGRSASKFLHDHVQRKGLQKVPYTVCKKVPYTVVKKVPVTTCRMVKETCVKEVPVTTCRIHKEIVREQVPYTVVRNVRGAYCPAGAAGTAGAAGAAGTAGACATPCTTGSECEGPGLTFQEGASYTKSVCCNVTRMVKETCVKKVPYTSCGPSRKSASRKSCTCLLYGDQSEQASSVQGLQDGATRSHMVPYKVTECVPVTVCSA